MLSSVVNGGEWRIELAGVAQVSLCSCANCEASRSLTLLIRGMGAPVSSLSLPGGDTVSTPHAGTHVWDVPAGWALGRGQLVLPLPGVLA